MTTTQPRRYFSGEDIGAEVLPILTQGLYRDSLDALREYIQNSIDAGSSHIELSINPDLVSVVDDGRGMTITDAVKAIRFGISDKNPVRDVGFRGIGIYSAFNICEQLEIFTRTATDPSISKIHFNFHEIRTLLIAEQRRRAEGKPPALDLERLLRKTVFVESTNEVTMPHSGTIALMRGILSETYRRLNDWTQVVEYLQNTVPLPFDPDFHYGNEIDVWLREADQTSIPVTLQIGSRRESVYRPYTNRAFEHEEGHQPVRFELKDVRHGEDFGFAWICVNDARKILRDPKLRGLIIKKRGFSISDRRYLEPYFVRTVYSRRITGEIVIMNDGLIPNAARSDFENNETRQLFLQYLPKFTAAVDEWANDIQENEKALEVLTELTSTLTAINAELPGMQRDRERLLQLNARLPDIDRRLRPQERRLSQLDKEGLTAARQILQGATSFVRAALLEHRTARQRLEREVVKALQRAEAPKREHVAGGGRQKVQTLIELFDAYGLIEGQALHDAMEHLDSSILREQMDKSDYESMLGDMQEYIEERI